MKHPTRLKPLVFATMAIVTLARTVSAQSADERAIREASHSWQRYIAQQQVDSIVALHTPDAVVMMANSPPMTGSNAVRAGWAEVVRLPNLQMQWTPAKIDVTSPTTATEYGTYSDSYRGPNGTEADSGSYLTLWKKMNGKWHVAYDAPVSAVAPAASMHEVPTDLLVHDDKIVYNDFRVPGFDPGVKMALIHGDPTGNGDYTLRLMFPDGYKFPVHYHPGAEHVTVISGTFLLAMGTDGDWSKVQSYEPGSFIYAPALHPHFGGARGVTVVQLHGQGPFAINLGAPK